MIDDKEESPSRVMLYMQLNDSLSSPSVVSEVSLGKSIHQFLSSSSLRMTKTLESLSSWNWNACSPSRMEANSGKSIHQSLSGRFTLKYCTRTPMECTTAKLKGFQSR